MSENLDLVRSILADWERGDFSSAEWAHRDVECVFAGGPDPGSWTGLTGMSEGMRSWISAWEEFRVEAEEYSGHSVGLAQISGVLEGGDACGPSRAPALEAGAGPSPVSDRGNRTSIWFEAIHTAPVADAQNHKVRLIHPPLAA